MVGRNQRKDALRRGRRLEYLTLSWNGVESIVSVGAGLAAGSPSLVGFGIDALIEGVSGATLLWRLQDEADHQRREAFALKLVGISFLLLAAWVAFESAEALVLSTAPDVTRLGIAIAALSLLVMPWLAYKKRQVAGVLESRALEADSRQTDLCAYLSAILLVGLLLNATFGLWWADPAAGLAMVPIIGREGLSALRGERCECD